MSQQQGQIWFADHWMNIPGQYNVVLSYKVEGHLIVPKLKRALENAVARHESLRTAFFVDPNTGELLQGILRDSLPFFSHVSSNFDDTAVSRAFDRFRSYPWDLEAGEVFAVTVVSVDEGHHTVVFAFHHIVMDGASMSAFLRDVERFYEGISGDIMAQYADYSIRQNRDVQIGTHAKQLEYWKEQLSPLPEIMPVLPCARANARPSSPSDNFQIHTSVRRVSTGLSQRIKEQSRNLRGTPFHFYLTALQVFLVAQLNINDLCIGMADANRRDEQFSGTVGYFLNMLPLRLCCKGTKSFSDMYRKTTSSVLSALSNSSIPSNLIVDALNVPREANVTPLFQVAINYRVGEITKFSVSDFDLIYERSVMGTAPYDISLHITPCADGSCLVEVDCRDYLYSSEAAQTITDNYLHILDAMSTDPSLDVPAITLSLKTPFIPMGEKGLSVSRGQRIAHDWPDTLIDRFQDMTAQYGDRVAVMDEMGNSTYDDLSQQILCMEELLFQARVKQGDKVAVLCRPSATAVISMLAILQVGAVYVPLDLTLPSPRHKDMVSASSCAALIYMPSTVDRARELGVGCMLNASDTCGVHIPHTPSYKWQTQKRHQTTGKMASILLYTSGSTGQPKGVCLPQRGFINYLAAKQKELGLDASAVILQQSSLGFDMGIAQTLNAIMNGARLVIVPQEMRGDSAEIARIMVDHGVNFTLGTPSEYLSLAQNGEDSMVRYTGWKYACLGGEPFTNQLKREFARLGDNGPELIQDSYGVTEISACTTFETMSVGQLGSSKTVGKAIPNTSLYIVDSDCKLVPTGEPGEICVGGVGVAVGYLDKEQTNKKFIHDPFALPKDIDKGWTELYRTGDRGRLLEDGSLVLLGRMDGDTEIKLRGLRIDLEDVASAMSEGISQHLVAFHDELQRLASNLPLPQYMHPARVICLDEIPRTSNGKVDRKAIQALPCSVPVDRTTEQKPKRFTLGEGELKLLWERILPDRCIEPESDFFLLGGNSALLVNLQGTIRTSIGVALTLRELYSNSTLAAMALRVSARKAEVTSSSINWAVETAMPPGLLAHADFNPTTATRTYNHTLRNAGESRRHILLTGATTFLGRSLLQALFRLPDVEQVHCIAVDKDESHDLPSNDKLVVYHGTLLDPTLGLLAQDWDRLSRCINVIIHAGSTGHCLNTYYSLKKPNVCSTHRLAQFALETCTLAPIHYISSPRTILFSGKNTYPPTSLAANPPLDKDGKSDGLTATKWVSEVFLERFAEVTGTKVVIHRPCTAIGDDAPAQDALNSLLRYSRDLGATPRLAKMNGFLDFLKVNLIADGIANAVISSFRDNASSRAASPSLSSSPSKFQGKDLPALDPSPSRLTSTSHLESPLVSFIHHSSNVKVPVNSFKEYMEKVHGRPFRELPLEEWSSLALELGIEPLIPSFLQAIDEGEDVVRYPYLGDETSC
ncbi:acetyl-CoA synthetase-like protein [Aspergillus venezuelensis]